LAYSASRFSEYKYFKYLPLTLILILLYTALPLYRGEMYKSNKYLAPEQVNLPSYYEDSATWMIENSKSLNPRVLIFPYNRLGLATLYNEDASFHYDSNHPYRFISNLGLIYGDGENQLSSYLDKYIYDEATIGTLISHYNIDYIILHNDTNWKYVNDNYWWTGTNFDLIQQQLNNSPCIKPVYTIGALDIYPIDPKCINNLNLIDAEAVPHISQSFKSMPIFGNNLFINTEYTNNDETEELSDFNEVKLVDMASIGAVNYADLWPNTRFSPDNFLYNLSKIKEAYSLLVISDSTKKIDNLIWLMAKRSEELNNWKYISDHAEAGVEQDILSKVDEVLYLIRQNKEVIGEEQLEKTLFYLRKIKKILNNLDDDHLASIIAAVDGLHTEVLTIKNERAYSQCQALCYKIGKTNVEVLYLFNQDFQPLGSVMMNGDRSENFRVFKTDNDYYLEDNTSNENLLEDIEWKTSTDFLSSPSKDGLEFKHFSDILTTNENSIPKIDIEYKSITDIDPTKVYYVEYSYKIVDPQYKFNFTLAEEMYDFSAKDRATIKLKTYRKKEHVYKELDNYIKVKMLYKPNELFAKKGKVYFMFNLTKKENDKNKSNNEDISTIVDIKDIKFYQMQNMTIYASKIEKPFFTLPLDFVNQLTIDYNLEKINPFTYKINFKNLSEEDRLFILNDKYHSDWQIHKDALSVSGPLGLVNKVLPFNLMLGKSLNIEHLEVNDMYNGWKVNSKALVNGEDYYIIFMPQVYLLQGLLITIILSLLAFGVALVNKFGGQQ
jgi:hypothetical protein